VEPKKQSIGIVGANHITLPVSLDLEREQYNVELFSATGPEDAWKDPKASRFPLVEVDELSIASLESAGLFDKDVIVLATADDDVNLAIATEAASRGASRIIARVEGPDQLNGSADGNALAELPPEVQPISMLYATR